ncbi:tripartite tricarboxylate transporter substrate binding protein [Rhodoplanes sp. TEM]|uniref:Tripartite tricarboxylate transporter substrate binding protein n=1 Tax=Rhodoplanes tepidamans TaxID=200616 RepID=A0ABT5J7H0_RHOTP|nr:MULTISPECIES: tripartite tricarboxylate transporter substrate binding protein [Rhodoplanes]MDC7785528.1 tripartite tricarboxylate transporter substrate binding protein [Rhodoplanes tepidamans]MDC7986190.1 tripartite tricarboxylate transporter substrate binding protein [Rhodoplanes sp. TEM]MDQ0353302.1 tripartite-type tricarboxylate transporter receptor subunit TctC [Rhodoplanes tepidamans]
MRRRDVLTLALGSLAGAALATGPGFAQGQWPDRPIRLVVPRSAGGVLDIVARHWAEWVKEPLGSIVVDNIGGGGGIIGTATVARSPADGYTLLLGSTSDLVLHPVLSPKAANYTASDFAPVATMAISVASIIVHPSVPAKDLKELAAYAKANPGKLSYGSAGAGTMANLAGELFKSLAGAPDIVHVPYKGAAGGYTDLISGQLPMFAANITDQMISLHRAGKVRILAVATEKRLDIAPELPTTAEAGYPELIAKLALGVFAPAGTPDPVLDKLAEVTRKSLDDADFRAKLVKAGFEPVLGVGRRETAEFIGAEEKRWTPVVMSSGLKTQ